MSTPSCTKSATLSRAARSAAGLALSIAALPAIAGTTVGFPEYPSLSPDGERLVFSWAGDLWAMSSDGGVAMRLTSHPADERRSTFSPDGTHLAFESDRVGSRSIYMMPLIEVGDSASGGPVVGGEISRVTVAPTGQTLGGFTADGESVIFASNQDPSIYRMARMFTAPLDGGPVERVTPAFGTLPRQGADGTVVFNRGYWNWERPAYRGPGDLDLWTMSPDGTFTQRTFSDGNDGDGHVLPDGSIVFVSSRDGQNNVWHLGANTDDRGTSLRQLTRFAPTQTEGTIAHGVRDLAVSADGTTAAFCVWDTLYTLDLTDASAEPVALAPVASIDSDALDHDRIDLDRRVGEAALSPDGNTMAVAARGEIFVRSTEDDRPTRRVTESVARERDLAWSPDNARIYFASDESGRYAIYEATVTLARADLEPDEPEEELVEDEAEDQVEEAAEAADDAGTDTEGDAAAGEPSDEPADEPADETDADTDEDADDDKDKDEKKEDKPKPGERWRDALRFETKQLIASAEHDLRSPTPSPDGMSLLYLRGRGDLIHHDLKTGDERVLLESWTAPDVIWAANSEHIVYSVEDLDFNSDIFLLDVTDADAEPVNLTRHPDYDTSPQLTADGTMLTFISDRGGRSWEFDVYGVYLDREIEGLTAYELDEHFADAGKAAKKRKPIDPVSFDEPDDLNEDTDESADDEADTEVAAEDEDTFAPDAHDAFRRIRRMTSLGNVSNLAMTPSGERIAFTASIDGDRALYSVDYRGDERKTVRSGGVSGVSTNLSGSKLTYVSSGQAHASAPTGGKATTYGIDAAVVVDIADQQGQKFLEAARTLGDNFYHPTLKDLDWSLLTERYKSLAMQTRTTDAFNRIGEMLFGELNGSHLGMWGGGGYSGESESIGALGVRTEPVPGGYRVTHVMDRSPATRPTSELVVGDIITAIDSTRIAEAGGMPEIDMVAAMAGTAGRETLIERVPADESASTHVLIVPASAGSVRGLAYLEEVERRRAQVEELSDGKLGYLHIQSMGMASVLDYERDLYAAANGKLGLVIDVRDNGGGWTTDILLASLTAPAHAYTIPRGANESDVDRLTYPRDRRLIYAYQRPLSVLINENSFSNAEIFAHSIKTTGRGTLVGTQTFGGVISTGSFTLIDGTRVRMPFRGWFLPDGTDMENNGAAPDIDVPISPADEAAGRDPQLEAAVKELLGRSVAFERELDRAPSARR